MKKKEYSQPKTNSMNLLGNNVCIGVDPSNPENPEGGGRFNNCKDDCRSDNSLWDEF